MHYCRFRGLLAVLLCAILFSSCDLLQTTEPEPVLGSIELGTETQLASGSISSSGGTLTVSSTDTLTGLTIDVPSGTLPEGRTFSVSYLPIKSVKNYSSLNPVTPMIRFRNGGGFANKAMEVTIPINIPEDHFALAFAYRAETGELEGIPLIDQNSKSIVISTRHFEHSQIMDVNLSAAGRKGPIVIASRAESDILVSSIPKAELMTRSYSTTFKPGQDDWNFANYGSVVKPKGHCAGQSFGMMYYYMIQKTHKAKPSLFGRYDNNDQFATPKIQYDDRAAYSFCTVLQSEYAKWNIELKRPPTDSITFMAFKYAMIVTERPQFIGILTEDGSSGHAMVVYGATANTLFIADPNYPGKNDRSISFANGSFSPYMSGDNAANLGTPYSKIYYTGMTSFYDWRIAHRQWPLVENRTVGTGLFPTFILKGRDNDTSEFKPIGQSWKTTTGKGEFRLEVNGAPLMIGHIFNPDGTIIAPVDDGIFDQYYNFFDGRRWVGFYFVAPGDSSWGGFRWVEVEGKNGPPPSRCQVTKYWETVLGSINIIYTDSLQTGERRVILEDLSVPEDLCGNSHVHPKWEVRGNLTGIKVLASAYWGGLFGRDILMTEKAPGHYEATMEIGLKQSYGDKPGWVGLQVEFKFPSRGTLNTDLKYLTDRLTGAKISMEYLEHRE